MQHIFKLPLQLRGHGVNPAFKKDVAATCLESVLNVSNLNIDFEDRILSRDPSSRLSHYKEISFGNNSTERIHFRMVESGNSIMAAPEDANAPIFVIAPLTSELEEGRTIPIRITFTPSCNGYFEKQFYIFLDSQPDSTRPYLTLTCRGSGVFPSLNFSTQLVAFQTVPLGITSRASFTVISCGYDALELNYRLSPSVTVPVTVEFPDGKEVGLTQQEVKVVVSFSSPQAISFYGQLIFFDKSNEKFAVNISGCADNCFFSNYSFLRDYGDSYSLTASENAAVSLISSKPLQQQGNDDKQSVKRKGSIELADPTSGVHADRLPKGRYTDAECVVLLRWLNRFACRRPLDVSTFPQCCYEKNGDAAVECIEQMSGKKIAPPQTSKPVSGKDIEDSKVPSTRASVVAKQMARFKLLLLSLIRSGALLSHVPALHLLGKEDFLFASELAFRDDVDRFTPAILVERKIIWEVQWESLCKQSWADVLFQALKIYMLSRATYKVFSNLPGVELPPPPAAETLPENSNAKAKKTISALYSGSNVMNENEAVLLAWLNYHVSHSRTLVDEGTPSNLRIAGLERIVDPLVDLKDLFPLCQVLHSHVPEYATTDGPLYGYASQTPTKQAEYYNYLRTGLLATRLGFDASYSELVSSGRIMMLCVLHLFLGLPSLISRTEIEFKGSLGEPIIRLISLKNPSKRAISYNVVLEGNADYRIKDNQLILEPESTVDFPVMV